MVNQLNGYAHAIATTYVCIVAICLRCGLVGLAYGKNACLGWGEKVVQIRKGL